MALSETVLAAMIGAIATIGTALFQLVSSLKSRTTVQTRTKGISFRSIIAIVALMVACGVGGFAYSELRIERDATQTLRRELMEQLAALQESTSKLELVRTSQASTQGSMQTSTTDPQPATSAEAVVELPPCPAQHGESTQPAACSVHLVIKYKTCTGDCSAAPEVKHAVEKQGPTTTTSAEIAASAVPDTAT